MASDNASNISAIANANYQCGTLDGKMVTNVCCNNTAARFLILKAVTGEEEDHLYVGWVDVKVLKVSLSFN